MAGGETLPHLNRKSLANAGSGEDYAGEGEVDDDCWRDVMEKKHSTMGIASFAISLMATLGMIWFQLTVFGFFGVKYKSEIAALEPIVVFFLTSYLAALGLGVAGYLHKDRKRTFAVLGIIISLIAALASCFLLPSYA